MTVKLSTREARKKLARDVDGKSRIEPFYVHLRHGVGIGYRPPTASGNTGHWLLREYRGNGGYVKRMLGLADDVAQANGVNVLSWEDVLKIAGGSDRPTATARGKHTVTDAWSAYCSARQSQVDKREQAIWTAFIEPKFGGTQVAELTTHELNQWLIAQTHQHGGRGQLKTEDRKDQLRRARDTANRRWTLFRSILNYAFTSDAVTTDTAWRKVKPFENVDRPRTVTVTAEQARLLLHKLGGPMRQIATGALYTGLRLGELFALRAADFDGSGITVRHSKTGRERRVPLNAEGIAFFAKRAKKHDPIFESMSRMDISRGMRAGCKAAEIHPVTFHDLRRSYGSLMLNSGAPIETIQEALGHADLRMTRRTYAHLRQETVAKAVETHLPSFKHDDL